MILDSTLLKLEAVLSGAVSANQPECTVDYVIWDKEATPGRPATYRTALNSASDVVILPAPAVHGFTIEPIRLQIYNKDTASVTVTVKTDDATTERIQIKATLLTLECLGWEKARGWFALDANGNLKEATSSVFSSLTVTGNETVGGTLGVTGATSVTTLTASGDITLSGGSATVTAGTSATYGAFSGFGGRTYIVVYGQTHGTYPDQIEFGAGGSAVGRWSTTSFSVTGTIKAGGYTVGTLPSNAAGLVAYVTDQLTAAAAKGVAPTGGGSVTCYVMNTGAGWVGI